mgnify:CR=1 FL=1
MNKREVAYRLRDEMDAKFYRDLDSFVLFGSVASGQETQTSDLDLYAISENWELKKFAIGLLSRYDFPISFVTETPEEFRRYLSIGDPFSISLIYTGIELLKRPTTFLDAQKEFSHDKRFRSRSFHEYLKRESVENLSQVCQPLENFLNRAYNAAAVALHYALVKDKKSVSADEINSFSGKQAMLLALRRAGLADLEHTYREFIELYYSARKRGEKTTIGELERISHLSRDIVENAIGD